MRGVFYFFFEGVNEKLVFHDLSLHGDKVTMYRVAVQACEELGGGGLIKAIVLGQSLPSRS